MSEKKPRKSYTPEFRRDAASIVIDQGVRIVSVAHELGVGEALLGRWVKHERERRQVEETGTPTTAQLHAEIARLRADNARLAVENEFLEKASAFFAIKQAQRNGLN
ncbi:transposase [Trueperella pecoris]|uniref:Transposase n=1 Tax=Trueperella pecoris TaxID=2733571 RepID=A0A7M1R165_9ACTO|nr:transposase [Trueperella pecoris]QOR47091.1 transposase [Trueperella pecoris]QOR47424.1 transposase [Trueperella pecoris]